MGRAVLVDTEFVAQRHYVLAALAAVGSVAGIGVGFFAFPVVISSPGALMTTGACQVGGLCREISVSTDTISANIVSREMLDGSFAAKKSWTVKTGTRVLLVPHHLVAAREIASLMSATPKPSVVYLIAPDHFSQGKTTLTTTDQGFTSTFGDVMNDSARVASLLREVSSLKNTSTPFAKEHGVTGLIPFIARAWPDVPVVPVIVRIDATEADRTALAAAIVKSLTEDPKALLVSSVDFSHYLPASVADFHDVLAQDVITSLADLEVDRVELDSPGALGITLKVARSLGLGDVTIQAHTNSLRLMKATIAQESTSHFLASFAPGEIKQQSVSTMLFMGDMMFDRTSGARIAASKDPAYSFARIRGAEDRFFQGQDLIVANLEGPVTSKRRAPVKSIDFAFNPTIPSLLKSVGVDVVSQANNHTLDQGRIGADDSRFTLQASGLSVFGDQVHDDATSSLAIVERRGQKIAFLGFNTTDNPLDESAVLSTLHALRTTHRVTHTVVFMHWGQEYQSKPNASQVARAHWFIDNGVDAVIGAHPHWMQSVETYKGRMIAYSLGNFIFDQDWSVETGFGLAVGLVLNDVRSELHLFPIKIELSQPRLLTGDERDARLKRLAEISDSKLKEQILRGVISIHK